MSKSVLIVGYGKRVREAALPALRAAEGLTLSAIAGRETREQDGEAISALGELGDLSRFDVIYVAVGKDAVPKVLAQLLTQGGGGSELLIETPVVRFKHYRHAGQLGGFAKVSVAEDCADLPWFEVVERAAGQTGPLQKLAFDRSVYAYHGIATAKALLGDRVVQSARRTGKTRRLTLAGGGQVEITEPRDYALGTVTIEGRDGSITTAGGAGLALEAVTANGLVVGFQAGPHETQLNEAESSLTGGDPDGAGVIARQEAMKRVGFLRIWNRIGRGEAGYPLDEGLDDMVVDYNLEKFGRLLPFTNHRSGMGRAFLRLATKFGG